MRLLRRALPATAGSPSQHIKIGDDAHEASIRSGHRHQAPMTVQHEVERFQQRRALGQHLGAVLHRFQRREPIGWIGSEKDARTSSSAVSTTTTALQSSSGRACATGTSTRTASE
jgi:hypothetical protein